MDGILSEFEEEMAGLIVEEEEAEQGQQQGDAMMYNHDRRVPPGDGRAAVHCSLNGMFSEDDDAIANLVVVEEQEQEQQQQQQQQDGSHAVEEAAGSDGASAAVVVEDTTCRTTPRYSGNIGTSSSSSTTTTTRQDDEDDDDDDENRRHRPGLNFLVTVTMLINAIRTTTMRHNFLKLFRPFADLVSYCITIDELDDTLENNTQRTTTTTTTDVCNKILRRRRRRRGQDDDKYGDDDHLENYNLHAFLEFDTDHFCWEIRGLLKRNYDNARIAVRCCRTASDRREFLQNVTSNDRFVLTNLRMDELHFNYRLSCWARRTRTSTIDYSDPFVVENRDRCRFLRRYLRDYQRQNVTLRDVIEQETDVDESVFYSEINVCYENWTKDVCRWWNKMMVYCRRRGRRPDGVDVDHSNRCLYLYGSTAAGKSTYVETILSAAGSRRSHNPLRHVYYPGVGRYFMRHFDVDFHRAIVFEEFDVGQYNVAMLKRLCEGRNYSYPVSRTRDRTMKFCGPIIFVSPDDTYIRGGAGEAFRRRLFVVHAAVPYWHCVKIIVPDSCRDDDDDVEAGAAAAQASSSSSSQSSSSPDATMVQLTSASAPPAAVEHDDDDNDNNTVTSRASSSDLLGY